MWAVAMGGVGRAGLGGTWRRGWGGANYGQLTLPSAQNYYYMWTSRPVRTNPRI